LLLWSEIRAVIMEHTEIPQIKYTQIGQWPCFVSTNGVQWQQKFRHNFPQCLAFPAGNRDVIVTNN